MSAEAFSKAWRLAYGPPPEDYVVIDVETTGFQKDGDRIVQVGWLTVVGGREVARAAAVVDWTAELDRFMLNDLADRMKRTAAAMARDNKSYGWTVDRLRAEGVPPREVVVQVADVLAARPVLVGHNSWRFDLPMLDRLCQAVTGLAVGVPPTQLIDTNAVVRALQSGVTPSGGETYRDFATRANSVGGTKYRSSLDDYCVTRFALRSRHGVERDKAHDAAYDCWLTHLVYSDFRHLVNNGRYPEGVAP